jgi:carboxylesterase type B
MAALSRLVGWIFFTFHHWLIGVGAVDVPYYNPSRWVQRSEKHIMVGINYRLNIFGWPNATGLKSNELNLGYLNQRLAIEWIRDNIAEFGGDPGRITLWGHSAGSVAVDSYKFAYPHDPIVNGLIMSSGTAHSVVKFAPANFTTVAEHFKCDTSNATAELDCMRDVPFRNITAWLKQRLDNKTTPAISFTPVTDNRTSWDNFTTRALAGEFIRKPAIIGTTVNEWAPFLPYNATYGPNQTAADEGTLGVFLCPSVLTTHESWAGGNATTFRYLYGGKYDIQFL